MHFEMIVLKNICSKIFWGRYKLKVDLYQRCAKRSKDKNVTN